MRNRPDGGPANGWQAAAVLLFAVEAGVLGFLTLMLALLLLVLLRLERRDGNLLILVAGVWGLGALWWMLLAFGLPGGVRRTRIPWPVWCGLGLGTILSGYLVVRLFLQRNAGLDLQALLLFGAPVAIAAHLLIRRRRKATP